MSAAVSPETEGNSVLGVTCVEDRVNSDRQTNTSGLGMVNAGIVRDTWQDQAGSYLTCTRTRTLVP